MTLYLTPVFFIYMERFEVWLNRVFRRHPAPVAHPAD